MKKWQIILITVFISASFAILFTSCDKNDDDGDDGDCNKTDDGVTEDNQAPDVRDTTQHANTPDEIGPYIIQTTASDNTEVKSLFLYYRVGVGELMEVSMTPSKGGVYQGQIPGQSGDSLIYYYVEAKDAAGNNAADPPDAPTNVFSFKVLETIEEDFQTDDGAGEYGWPITQGADGTMLAKIMIPSGYPAYLTEISLVLFQGSNGLFDFEVVVYQDLSGGDPTDAKQVWISGSQTQGMEENYEPELYTFDVKNALADTPLPGGTWVISVMNYSGQLYLNGDTDFSGIDPNAWGFDRDTGIWETFEDLFNPTQGTFIIRAKGYYIIE